MRISAPCLSMSKISKLVIFSFVVLGLSHFTYAQTEDISATLKVKGNAVKKGITAKAVIEFVIPDGLHVNSNKPSGDFMIPTTASVKADKIKLGALIYPAGEDKMFPFSRTPINIYDGTVRFSFNVTVPRSFKGKTVKVTAKVNFQACSDEVCYQPESRTVETLIRVR